jgi:hypothetical protein
MTCDLDVSSGCSTRVEAWSAGSSLIKQLEASVAKGNRAFKK